jgi:hypothetical protein
MVHTHEILRGLGQPGSAIVIAGSNPTERPRREITRRTSLVRDLRGRGEDALLVGTVIADRATRHYGLCWLTRSRQSSSMPTLSLRGAALPTASLRSLAA